MLVVGRIEAPASRRDVILVVPPSPHVPATLPEWARDPAAVAGFVVHVTPGQEKWPAVAALLAERPDLLSGAGSVWIPDTAVVCPAGTVDALFALHEELHLQVSHPALSFAGAAAHPLTRPHPGFSVRWVDHVEQTAPMFARDALRRVLPTFGAGDPAGLPHAWRVLVASGDEDAAVLDCLPVTVPGGAGPVRRHAATPAAVEHGVAVPCAPRLFGGLDPDFARLGQVESLRLSSAHVDGHRGPTGSDSDRYAAALRTDLVLATGEV